MSASLITSQVYGFANGNGGHGCVFTAGAPAAGNLDVLCVNSDTTVSTPSGFTVATTFVNSQGSYIFYRFAAGGESATVTVTTSGNFDTEVIWSRWAGASVLDVAKHSQVDGIAGTSTPAIDTDALAGTNELVVAFAALHGAGAGSATSPVWSTGYTALNTTSQGACQAFVGYRTDSGADETPSVSWTGSVADRYMLVAAFTPAAEAFTGTATITASASLTGTGTAARHGSAAVAGTSALTSGGSSSRTGTSNTTGASTLTAPGASGRIGTSTVPASSALATTGVAHRTGTATITATGSLYATAVVPSRDLEVVLGPTITRWSLGATVTRWATGPTRG